jgi:SAM-dependent methyltransferase
VKFVKRAAVADWSLPREDLSRRASEREGFRPPPHERAQGSLARFRVSLRRFADLQFGSIWRDLAALLPKVEGTLADVGCGAQPFRDLLRPEVRYIAVDIDDPEQQFGYGAPGHGTSDTRYFRGRVLPLADGEADTVLCTETLEHVLDTVFFLNELKRALAPGGWLILTVPFAARWHFVPQDYWRFTPSGLKQLLGQAGFCDTRVYARGGALTVAAYKVLGLVLLLLAGQGRHGFAGALSRLIGLGLLPLAALAALLGHVGLKFPGTAEDTLGYTVLARRVQG